jgi:prepilin-type N-terminal cleavage/methylation domain-containing protein
MNSLKRGFTLIELLVVIAIIGVLSAVILANLNIARGKGSNAAIKSNLNTVRPSAEIVYDQNSGFYGVGLCTDIKVRSALDAAGTAATGVPADAVCNSDNLAWAAQSPLKVPDADGNTYWCVDNQGTARGSTVALGTDLICP